MCSLELAAFNSSNCVRHFTSSRPHELCPTARPYLVFLLVVYNLHLGDVHHIVTGRISTVWAAQNSYFDFLFVSTIC